MCEVQTVLFGYFWGGNSSNLAKPGTVCTRVVNLAVLFREIGSVLLRVWVTRGRWSEL
jgi:hypothetical protein